MTDPADRDPVLMAVADGLETWLVYSRQHNAFWRANASGYTVHIEAAGRYSEADAMWHCGGRNPDKLRDGGPTEFMVPAPEALLSERHRAEEAMRERAAAYLDQISEMFENDPDGWCTAYSSAATAVRSLPLTTETDHG